MREEYPTAKCLQALIIAPMVATGNIEILVHGCLEGMLRLNCLCLLDYVLHSGHLSVIVMKHSIIGNQRISCSLGRGIKHGNTTQSMPYARTFIYWFMECLVICTTSCLIQIVCTFYTSSVVCWHWLAPFVKFISTL